MTPLIFIIVAILVLSLLIYWIMITIKQQDTLFPDDQLLKYENALEIASNPTSEKIYLAENSIKLRLMDNVTAGVYWNLTPGKFEQIGTGNRIKSNVNQIVLRITEAGTDVHHSDIWVKALTGQYKFQLQPHHLYYISLGINDQDMFIPLLTSETISLPIT